MVGRAYFLPAFPPIFSAIFFFPPPPPLLPFFMMFVSFCSRLAAPPPALSLRRSSPPCFRLHASAALLCRARPAGAEGPEAGGPPCPPGCEEPLLCEGPLV